MISLALLLQAAAAATAQSSPAPPAPWTVIVRPKTDPAVTSTIAGTPSIERNAQLVLRCDAGPQKIVSLQLFTRVPLGGPPNRSVVLTIDAAAPLAFAWSFVQQAAVVRDDMPVTKLTAAIAGGKSIKLHTTTVSGEAVDASFTGPPSPDPIKAVLAACDYKLGKVPAREDPNKPRPLR